MDFVATTFTCFCYTFCVLFSSSIFFVVVVLVAIEIIFFLLKDFLSFKYYLTHLHDMGCSCLFVILVLLPL